MLQACTSQVVKIANAWPLTATTTTRLEQKVEKERLLMTAAGYPEVNHRSTLGPIALISKQQEIHAGRRSKILMMIASIATPSFVPTIAWPVQTLMVTLSTGFLMCSYAVVLATARTTIVSNSDLKISKIRHVKRAHQVKINVNTLLNWPNRKTWRQ